MIVPMEKITLLTTSLALETTLKQLRELGVVHITPLQTASSSEGEKLEEELQALDKTLASLSHFQPKIIHAGINKPIKEIVSHILELQNQKEEYLALNEECNDQLFWYETWGKISLNSLQTLKENGLYTHFYIAPNNYLEEMGENKNVFILKHDKTISYVVLISQNPDEKLHLKEEILPTKNIQDLQEKIKICENKIKEIENSLNELSGYRDKFIEYKHELLKGLEFEQVKNGMKNEKKFSYLQGFAPKNSISKIKETAMENGWGYLIEKPAADDDIPTLIKMPKWLKMVKPVFSFMGTIPGYKEFDISFWFMLFFMIFVAMLIGDAGYGLIFLLFAVIFHIKKGQTLKSKEVFYLIYALSLSTMIWGAVTGTWFGVEKIARLPFFKDLIIPALSTFNPIDGFNDNQKIIMFISFLIGAIHLTLAHLIIIFRKLNSLSLLSDVGWIGIIWGMYYIAGLLVLNNPLPPYGLHLLIIGCLLVLLFNAPQKNIFKLLISALKNLSSFILDIIGVFSHVVSYIRLFAVGLATVVVASSFNAMAYGEGITGISSGIKATLIFIAGHGLNIILAVMAVIVHGIRLNMLEFSGHLGMEWAGKEYKPFKE